VSTREAVFDETLTEAQAVALYDSGFWKQLSPREIAEFQMFTSRLCMPFEVFHEAIEKTLGRSVWTHDFGLNQAGLQAELRGELPAPSFAEIFALIPADKRVLVVVTP
jgi:hypothetical protein